MHTAETAAAARRAAETARHRAHRARMLADHGQTASAARETYRAWIAAETARAHRETAYDQKEA